LNGDSEDRNSLAWAVRPGKNLMRCPSGCTAPSPIDPRMSGAPTDSVGVRFAFLPPQAALPSLRRPDQPHRARPTGRDDWPDMGPEVIVRPSTASRARDTLRHSRRVIPIRYAEGTSTCSHPPGGPVREAGQGYSRLVARSTCGVGHSGGRRSLPAPIRPGPASSPSALRSEHTNGTSLSESLYSFWVYGEILGHEVKARTTEQAFIKPKSS
jgi:hypothetical protein